MVASWLSDSEPTMEDRHAYAMDRLRERKLDEVRAGLAQASLSQLTEIARILEGDDA